jgi:hypothetical protein
MDGANAARAVAACARQDDRDRVRPRIVRQRAKEDVDGQEQALAQGSPERIR